MCIIIAKDAETKLDKNFLLEGIKEAWNPNRHGAGYAVREKTKGAIWLDKGYFDRDEFIQKIDSVIEESDEFVIHLRLATSGEQDDVNCHPFIITPNEEELEIVEGYTKKPIIAHNGVIGEFADRSSNHSDTFRFVQLQLSMWIPKYYKVLLDGLGHNKFAVLDPKKGLSIHGNFIREKGIYFSNGGYKKSYSYGYSSNSAYSNTY